jgi:SpoIID/LytB domain protein
MAKNTASYWSKTRFLACMACLLLVFPIPLFSKGKRDTASSVKITPIKAYYAGNIEETLAVFSQKRASVAEKTQLVVLYWELGEMHKAASLLEELLKEKDLSTDDKNELQVELFYTYCLIGSYNNAATLRSGVERHLLNQDERTRAEFYFYSGLVAENQGSAEKAQEHYKKSLDLYKWRPIAWFHLGLLQREKDPKKAEKSLQTCWQQDSSFTNVLLPLARLHMDKKEWKKAANYLYTANARLPGNKEINTALAEIRRHILFAGPSDDSYLIRRNIKATPPKVKPGPTLPKEGSIRIGLIEKQKIVSVKAGGDYIIHAVGNRTPLYAGKALEQFWINVNQNGLMIFSDKDKKIIVRSSNPLIFEMNSNEDTSIVAGVVNGASGTNRTYRGMMEFRPSPEGMTVVNIVSMEEYLYAVVPSEMPVSWPAEALKAQAIAARSYAIAYLGNFANRGFDLFGTPHSMAYHGVESEHKNTLSAVDLTRGVVLFGETKQPLRAYFSANHGGYSEDSLTLWGYDASMKAVPDKLLPPRNNPLPLDVFFRWVRDTPATYSNVPKYSHISAYRWEKWVSPEEIRRRLAEDPGEIRSIVTRGRGISGRIVQLEVKGSKGTVMVKGDAIWRAMGGLRSSLFTIRHKLDKNGNLEYFVFQGAGYGHGIGLDQHGAAGMASAGISAEEILRHYYPRSTQGPL